MKYMIWIYMQINDIDNRGRASNNTILMHLKRIHLMKANMFSHPNLASHLLICVQPKKDHCVQRHQVLKAGISCSSPFFYRMAIAHSTAWQWLPSATQNHIHWIWEKLLYYVSGVSWRCRVRALGACLPRLPLAAESLHKPIHFTWQSLQSTRLELR